VKRYRLRVPAAQAEPALARMLDLFPGGVEEERDGDDVILAGYAERPPGGGLEAEDVAPGWEDGWRASTVIMNPLHCAPKTGSSRQRPAPLAR